MANTKITFEAEIKLNEQDIQKKINNIDSKIGELKGHAKDIFSSSKGNTDIGKKLLENINKTIDELQDIKKNYTQIISSISNQKIDTREFNNALIGINERFELVEKRVNGVEESLSKLVARFDKKLPTTIIQKQISDLETKFDSLTESTKSAMKTISAFNDLISSSVTKPKDIKITTNVTQLKDVEKILNRIDSDDVLNGESELKINTASASKQLFELYQTYTKFQNELSNAKDPKQITTIRNQMDELLPTMGDLVNRIIQIKKLDLNQLQDGSIGKISFGKIEDFSEIFSFIEQEIGSARDRLTHLRNELKDTVEEVADGVTTNVSTFTFKNGGIRIPVTVDAKSAKALENKYDEIVGVLQEYAKVHPVNVTMRLFPLNTNRAGAEEITNELRRIQTDINSVEDEDLKIKLNSLYDDLEAQFKKALDLKIKVDLGATEQSVQAQIKNLAETVKQEGFTIYPNFKISDEESKKISKALSNIQKNVTFNLGKDLETSIKEINKLLTSNNAERWSGKFANSLQTTYEKLEKIQPIVESLANFFVNAKLSKNSIISDKDVNNVTILSNSIKTLKESIDRIDFSKINSGDFIDKIQNEINNATPILIPINPDLSNINSFIDKIEDAISSSGINVNIIDSIIPQRGNGNLQSILQDKDNANKLYLDIYKGLDGVAGNIGSPLKKQIALSLVTGIREGMSDTSQMIKKGLTGTQFESIIDQLIGNAESLDTIKRVANEAVTVFSKAYNGISQERNVIDKNILSLNNEVEEVTDKTSEDAKEVVGNLHLITDELGVTNQIKEGLDNANSSGESLYDTLNKIHSMLFNEDFDEIGGENAIVFNSKTGEFNTSIGTNGFTPKAINTSNGDYNLHTHPWGVNSFSKGDLETFSVDLKDGIKHQLLLSLNGLLDLDLGKMSPEDLNSIVEAYDKVYEEIVDNAKNSLTLKDVYETQEKFEESLRDNFEIMFSDKFKEISPLRSLGDEVFKILESQKDVIIEDMLEAASEKVGDFDSNQDWFIQVEREIDVLFSKYIIDKVKNMKLPEAKNAGLPAVQTDKMYKSFESNFAFTHGFADNDIIDSVYSYKIKNNTEYAQKIHGAINAKLRELIEPLGGVLTEISPDNIMSYIQGIVSNNQTKSSKQTSSSQINTKELKEEETQAKATAEANKEVASSRQISSLKGQVTKIANQIANDPDITMQKYAEGATKAAEYINKLDELGVETSEVKQKFLDITEDAYLKIKPIDTSESREEIAKETDELNEMPEAADKASEAKKEFADANAELLSSIIESLKGLNSEGDGFNNLNKLINNLTNNKNDRITDLVVNLELLRDVLIKPIDENSFINAIKQIASQGDSLKDLAAILKSSKNQIEDTKKQTVQSSDSERTDKIKQYIKLINQRNKLEAQNVTNNKFGTNQARDDEIVSINKEIIELQKLNFTQEENQKITQETSASSIALQDAINKANAAIVRQNNTDASGLQSYQTRIQNTIVSLEGLQQKRNYVSSFSNELDNLHNELITLYNDSQNKSVVSDTDIQRLTTLISQLKQYQQQASLVENRTANENSISKGLAQINDILSSNTKLSFTTSELYQEFIELQNAYKNFDTSKPQTEVNALNTRLQQLKARFNELDDTTKGGGFLSNFVKRLGDMNAKFFAQYFSFQDIIRYARTMFTTIQDLDTQLVDLRKTTTMTSSELDEFYTSSADVAKQMGVTTSEIISQASAWSRLGYSSQEAATQMAALSSQFTSISPGMTTDNATDYLVSTMQAYGIAVDDVERKIMDNVNKIGNTFATTNAEIGEMLTRSSAAMKAANNTLEETIALESAAVQITRNAETTGTAFRTISMRIRGKQSLPPYSESYMLCA